VVSGVRGPDIRRLADNPIAIVGMAGLFPMAGNVGEYWQNIVDARDCTAEVPADRWDVADYFDPDPATQDKTYARRGGFLPEVAFDPVEFGLPPNHLEVTSTLQTLSLVVARDLLRDAGAVDSEWYDPQRTGVVLGVTGPVPLTHPLGARLATPVLREVVRGCGLTDADATAIADKFVRAFAPWEENSFPGLLGNITAGRVANRLGLGGLNSTVDAACAASLSAVRLAVAELVDGRADMMITGGCDTSNSIFMYLCFSKTLALSGDDRIRPFDESANGTLLGEGIGMLALKRLTDAERDGDRVYAVIRGIGSASDGRARSIYAPDMAGQRLALCRAYADADCSPASVGLFEAHATGTAVGDRTELAALLAVLREAGAAPAAAAIGSVKSQIGHTKGAAGAASLIKLAFSLHQRTLPPTINVQRPNASVTEPDAPFYVNTKTRPWIRDPRRPVRRAAASAMGFGGINFHVVLDEHESSGVRRQVLHRTARGYLWHAPDVTALTELVRSAAPAELTAPIPPDAVRLGFAAAEEDVARLRAVAATQLDEQPDAEEWTHPAGIFFRGRAVPNLRIGALFAGQGSQYVDMGLETLLNNPTVAAVFDQANATFADADRSLAATVFPPETFHQTRRGEQESAIHHTEYAQPAIGALAAGQFRHLTELGLDCAGFLGHSFGELTALWAVGSLSDDDFFRLARARGQAMVPTDDVDDAGAMAAIEADRARVDELLADQPDVVVCNHNAPDQVVVGGASAAVATLAAQCRAAGLITRPLRVAAAFHTRYVAYAVDRFRPAVQVAVIGAPARPVYANSPGVIYGADLESNRDSLVRQLLAPVEFVAGLRAMHSDGCTVFVEFGPKQVLTQLVRRTLGIDGVVAIPTDAGPLGDGDLTLRQAAVRLAVLGAPITGLNRYAAPAPAQRPTTPATVLLTGAEHVPESRKADYRAALADGYRVTRPGSPTEILQPKISQPEIPPLAVLDTPAGDDLVARHLSLHSRYLEGQLRIAEGLVDALRRSAGTDRDVAGLLRVAEMVKEQSVAIGRTHVRANEILSTMATLAHNGMAYDGPVDTDPPRPVAPPIRPNPAEPVPTSVPAIPAPGGVMPEPPISAAADDLVRSTLLDVVAQYTGYPTSMIDTGMDLEADLGIDSIKRVQIFGAVRERFADVPAVGPELLGEIRTLDDMVAFITPTDSTPSHPANNHPLPDPVGPSTQGTDVRPVPVELVSLARVDIVERAFRASPSALVVTEDDTGDDTATSAFTTALTAAGWTVRRTSLLAPAVTAGERFDLCLVLLGGRGDWSGSVGLLAATVRLAGRVLPALTGAVPDLGRIAFVTVTRLDGRLGLRGVRDPAQAVVGGVAGLVKTLAREQPMLFCRALDLDPALDATAAARLVLTEIADAARDVLEIGVAADGTRWTVCPSPYGPAGWAGAHRLPPAPLRAGSTELTVGADDLLVVTGGARGITGACVRALGERTRAEFVLLGRTPLVDEPVWAAGVPDAGLRDALLADRSATGLAPTPRQASAECAPVLAQREIRNTVAALADVGSRASYLAVDVCDRDAVLAALTPYAGRVTGVVHGAGELADSLLGDKTAEGVDRVLAPKLTGLHTVLDALREAPLRHLLVFTSVAGLLGNPGQADYAAANEALHRVLASLRREWPHRQVTAIDWGAWDGGMVGPELREMFRARGVPMLGVAEGTAAFVARFTEERAGDTRVLIGSSTALTGVARRPATPGFTARRELRHVEDTEVLQAHRIGDDPVLPATFGLGWLANVAERAHPGLQVVECRGFQVHKGIVFTGEQEHSYLVEVDPTGHGPDTVVRARVLGAGGRPHYSGTFVLAAQPPRPPAPEPGGWFAGQEPVQAASLYHEGVLFHGPRLQGIRRVLRRSAQRSVFECRLPDDHAAATPYASVLHRPVLADLLLQAACLQVTWHTGLSCLPLGIGRLECFAPLPDDATFVVVVDNPRTTAAATTVNVAAYTEDGAPLSRLTDVAAVGSPELSARFVHAARVGTHA
jgi:acyl transferase domain-containing protein/NADP-dependent 3-hydroxy acid dehydrogenase YdfG